MGLEMVQMEIFGIHSKYLVSLELVKGEVELQEGLALLPTLVRRDQTLLYLH